MFYAKEHRQIAAFDQARGGGSLQRGTAAPRRQEDFAEQQRPAQSCECGQGGEHAAVCEKGVIEFWRKVKGGVSRPYFCVFLQSRLTNLPFIGKYSY